VRPIGRASPWGRGRTGPVGHVNAMHAHRALCPGTAEELLAGARFGIPEPTASHVRRARLLERLAEAGAGPLVVVSAPAGTGKTSLVAEWVRETDPAGANTGWITFEEEDTSFWAQVLECLARLGFDVTAVTHGRPTDAALGRSRLASLARLVTEAPEALTVVVDGYEMVSTEQAREVDYLLRRTFGRLRLVLVSRVDPVLPLYRYRLNETLVEVRGDHLAFTDDEASVLLANLGVGLSPEGVHDLNQRTRGWVTGLRFAARALAGCPAAEESAASMVAQTGDINEYLLGEVLDRQSPDVRRLLLETSVPDVLSVGLVEAIGGQRSLHTLAELVRTRSFVEVVPGRPGYFRYFPFFRDLLRAQLAYEAPDLAEEVHRRVAGWYAREGLVDQAIGHLAAISAWEELSTLVIDGLKIGRLLMEGADGPLAEVARRVPSEVGQRSACLLRAALALTESDPAGAAEGLARARRPSAVDAARDATVIASTATLDAVLACLAGPASTALEITEEAARLLGQLEPTSDPASLADLRGLAALSGGVAWLRHGDLRAARRELASAARSVAAESHMAFKADCLGYLALCDAWEGHLSQATRAAAESSAAGRGVLLGGPSPAARVALARVALEQYELTSAERHLAAVSSLRGLRNDPVSRAVAATVRAGLEGAAGRLDVAVGALEEAVTALAPTSPWWADSLRVEAAGLCSAAGRSEAALELLERTSAAAPAAVVVATGTALAGQGSRQRDAATALSEAAAERLSLRMHVSVLLAEAAHESSQGASAHAVALVKQALSLAAPELLRRPFREAVPATRRLLATASVAGREHGWLDSHVATAVRPRLPQQRGPTEESPHAPESPVVEQLTVKELEVLGHLEDLLTTEEIAAKMFVSVNTVRTHVRSILRKLGVNRRYAAVRKARSLGILQV
jgi:LuxR family transcriptional regulator, maltose regulon positive regulatory protein